jgi:hypothetical protein
VGDGVGSGSTVLSSPQPIVHMLNIATAARTIIDLDIL